MKKESELKSKTPNPAKPYVVRNFFKEIRRVTWPTKKKNNQYFLWTLLFIIILVLFFALISFGASKIIELIGAN